MPCSTALDVIIVVHTDPKLDVEGAVRFLVRGASLFTLDGRCHQDGLTYEYCERVRIIETIIAD